jgi:branched-subunit amino acid aminotransferase/4-amino-4-deoxychorismate lyase
VLRLAHELGIHAEVGNCTVDDLMLADECFLTNAVRGIRPVGRVHSLVDFGAGAITSRLREALEASDE